MLEFRNLYEDEIEVRPAIIKKNGVIGLKLNTN